MKVDLHLHSKFSWDSKVEIKSYISEAERKKFGAISVTDHNTTENFQILQKLQEDTEVILIPGQEVSTLDGHLLVYGFVSTLPKHESMSKTIKHAKKEGECICIAAHPFDKLRGGKGKKVLTTGIDGIETLNASTLFGYFNTQAMRAVRGTDLFAVGNSDAHQLSEFGVAFTEINTARSFEQVLKNLRTGTAMGKRLGIWKKSIRFFRRKIH